MSMHVLLLHPYEVLYCSAHARVHNEILTPSPPPIIAQTQGLDKAGGREATKLAAEHLGGWGKVANMC